MCTSRREISQQLPVQTHKIYSKYTKSKNGTKLKLMQILSRIAGEASSDRLDNFLLDNFESAGWGAQISKTRAPY